MIDIISLCYFILLVSFDSVYNLHEQCSLYIFIQPIPVLNYCTLIHFISVIYCELFFSHRLLGTSLLLSRHQEKGNVIVELR